MQMHRAPWRAPRRLLCSCYDHEWKAGILVESVVGGSPSSPLAQPSMMFLHDSVGPTRRILSAIQYRDSLPQ